MILSDDHYAKRAPIQHARKMALPVANGQRLRGVVPVQRDGRIDSFFVIVAIAFVFVEGEVAVGSAIDAQFDRVRGLFARPLLVGPERKNGARANKERNAVERRGSVEGAAAIKRSSGPEIEPLRCRKIKS